MKYRNSIVIPGLIYILVLMVLLVLIFFLRDKEGTALLILISAAIFMVVTGLFYFIFGVYYPLANLNRKLKLLSRGESIENELPGTTMEFKEIELVLQNHSRRLKEIIKMANNLAEGRIEDSFEVIGENDELGQALLKVKESILKSKEETVHRRELDEQQNWASKGLAKFGVLLRDFENDVNAFSYRFIHELVEYLDMEVGGLFLLNYDNEKDPVLELTGAYAFDREKQFEQSFRPGEGLVGRCAIEKASIIINDVPEDYIKIRSGMGEDNPSTIVLVPIMFNDQVLGVIELATFSEVAQYKIDFLESLGSSIASSVSKGR